MSTSMRPSRKRVARTLAASSLALALGCSGGADVGAPDLAAPPDLAMPDLRFAGYPPGPYGGDVGSTLPNFILQGYFSPTSTSALASTQKFGEVSFDAMRSSGKRYALLQLAGFW